MRNNSPSVAGSCGVAGGACAVSRLEDIEAVGALLRRVGGRVLSANPSSYIVELTSTEIEVGEFIASVAAFGDIVEVVRSGVLGIARANPRLHAVK